MEPIPIACNILVLDPREREQRADLAERMRSRITSIRELEDGFVFALDADPEGERALSDLLALERRCCPFLRFEVGASGEKLELRITGEEGVKSFLLAEFSGEKPDER